MKIEYLGLTASVKGYEICLWDESFTLVKSEVSQDRFFHKYGLTHIETLLGEYNTPINSLKGIVVDTGPASSFTGLRLSITIIKTIAYLYKIPLYEVSSLSLLVNEAAFYNPFLKYGINLGLLKGNQNRIFAQGFEGLNPILTVKDVKIENIGSFITDLLKPYQDQEVSLVGNALDELKKEDLKELKGLKHLIPIEVPKISHCEKEGIRSVSFEEFLPRYHRKTQAQEAKEQ